MKAKVVVGLLLAGQVFSAQATALACVGLKAAGLYWENNRWKNSGFELGGQEKFILRVNKDNSLDKESVKKIIGIEDAKDINCPVFNDSNFFWSCSSFYGDFLFLSQSSLQGSISTTFGSTQPDSKAKKDTVAVTTFKCEKF